MLDTSKFPMFHEIRVNGEDFALAHIDTYDLIVVWVRLAQIHTAMLKAGIDATGSERGISGVILATASLVNGFRIADIKPGGDLYPLIAAIHGVSPAGVPVPLVNDFDRKWSRRLTDLVAVCREAVTYYYPDFTQSFSAQALAAFRAGISEIAPETSAS